MNGLEFPAPLRKCFADVYEPAEDSFFLLDVLENEIFEQKIVKESQIEIAVELCCGSGIISINLARRLRKACFFCTDINPSACKLTADVARLSGCCGNVHSLQTDLSGALDDRLSRKIDLLFCNPPYVPTDEGEEEADSTMIGKSWAGGKNGTEIVVSRFLPIVDRLLSSRGFAYLLVLDKNGPFELIERANKLDMIFSTEPENDQISQNFKGLSLAVITIRHYVLDASSKGILVTDREDIDKTVLPFDGYDVQVTDGTYQAVMTLADPRLAKLIQKHVFKVGSLIVRLSGRMCYSERKTRHKFFLITDFKLDNTDQSKIKVNTNQLIWWPGTDSVEFSKPLLSRRLNFTSFWNISDPIGDEWDCSDIQKVSIVPRGYSLTEMIHNLNEKSIKPVVVRVLAKSRLNYFAANRGNHLDMRTCPYQFDVMIADDRTCCLAVFWSEYAVKFYKKIQIGSVLLIRSYRVKHSFKQRDFSATCFDANLERFNLELSVSEKMVNGKYPVEIVDLSASSLNLPKVPFNFVSFASLRYCAAGLNNFKVDTAAIVIYAGRWNREARRYFRSLDSNEDDSQDGQGASLSLVVSSLNGDKYVEELNSGSHWMWRWLVLADGSGESVRVKYYCSSQPDIQYLIKPGDSIVLTQMRLAVMNKYQAKNSRFRPEWCLTTTNESQIFNLNSVEKENSDLFLDFEQISGLEEYSENVRPLCAFNGAFDYPPYPEQFEALADSFQPVMLTETFRDIHGPLYAAAPQVEVILDGLALFEHRCLLVHGSVASVRFLPIDFVVRNLQTKTISLRQMTRSKGKPRKDDSLDSCTRILLAKSWDDRRLGFRSLGVDIPHWRSVPRMWQSKSADDLLYQYLSIPPDRLHSDTDPKLNLTVLSTIAGFLQVQLLLINHPVYLNCLVPVPHLCKFQAPSDSDSSVFTTVFDTINSCCRKSWEYQDYLDSAHSATKKTREEVTKSFRQFSNRLGQLPPSSGMPIFSAVIHCYGLGGDDVEIGLRYLYPLP